jgi:D-alanyl-D-alanine carboxypeptidase
MTADLAAMRKAAAAAKAPVAVASAYRSFSTQRSTFAYWVRVGGYAGAVRASARAGHSEHQLGTTFDFKSAGGAVPWNYADWAKTTSGKWMAANAWRYGFVMSYPKGKTALTCYNYEPWHYRYFGRTIAAAIHASGQAPRVWLWQHGQGG